VLASFNLYKQQGKGEIEKIVREGAIKRIEEQQKERETEKNKNKNRNKKRMRSFD
jgi:hypothetical protein